MKVTVTVENRNGETSFTRTAGFEFDEPNLTAMYEEGSEAKRVADIARALFSECSKDCPMILFDQHNL